MRGNSRRAGRKGKNWCKKYPERIPPHESRLTERKARSDLSRLFVPNSAPFDNALMTDEAREQFSQDADGVV